MAYTVIIGISDLEHGGAQRQAIELANHLDPNEFSVYVCSLSDYVPLADSLKDRNHRLKIIKRRVRFDFTVVFRLIRLFKRLEVDVVHSYLFDATIASRLAGCFVRRPVVISSERNTDYKFKKTDFIALMLTSKLNDMTIANSNAGAKFNSKVFKQKINRYRVVHNGVDTDRFRPLDGMQTRAELGLNDRLQIVGMFASFKSQKNHPLLFRAARHIIRMIPEVRFLFVGDELYKGMSNSYKFKKYINQLVDDYGLRQYCIFVGNKIDVEKYYSACDVTVLPSLFEGTPNVALESMACGVPVVATGVSDNKYVIPDGRVGYIVSLDDERILADKICQILLNQELRVRLSLEARRWVTQEFSCQRLAEKTAAVYKEIIQLKNSKHDGSLDPSD